MSSLADRYQAVQARIASACDRHGRNRADVQLVVVSKFHPASLVEELIDLGQTDFGENKDQEASPKAAEVRAHLEALGRAQDLPRWHFVGQLQSNKVKSVLRYASTIHSLDRESLLTALNKEFAKDESLNPIGVFIELNLTDDPNRGGIHPDALLRFAEDVLKQPKLKLLGVMGVATLEGQEERDFTRIKAASESLQMLHPEASKISAGMSNDFELAIGFGATHLRVGTAITGPRQYLA